MSEPRRIQRKRTKGWRLPPNAVYVGRPSAWGNPCRSRDRAEAVRKFRLLLDETGWGQQLVDEARLWLAGRDLACWCPLDQPCHADVLLEIANGGSSE